MTIHKSRYLSTIYLSDIPIVSLEGDADDMYHRFASFPYELLLEVFKFLEPEDLGRVACVCHEWNNLSGHGILWREICIKYYPEETEERLAQLQQQADTRISNGGTLARSNDLSVRAVDNTTEGSLRRRATTSFLKQKLKVIKNRNSSMMNSSRSARTSNKDRLFKELFVEVSPS